MLSLRLASRSLINRDVSRYLSTAAHATPNFRPPSSTPSSSSASSTPPNVPGSPVERIFSLSTANSKEMLKYHKQQGIKKYGRHSTDTGSAASQGNSSGFFFFFLSLTCFLSSLSVSSGCINRENKSTYQTFCST
jgi:hypothetical protein